MKKASLAAAALAFGNLFSTAAMAKDVDLKACTADGYTAVLTAHIDDNAIKSNPRLPKQLNDAFADVAGSLSAKDFNSDVGGQAFLGKGLALDRDFFEHVHFTTDPTMTPGCSL